MIDSPLLPFVDGATPVADFTVTPTLDGELPSVAGLLAGAAEVDLTPPPGMPKDGHSRNAHDGNGFRTRIRARVLHLRAGTTSLALVATDLMGGSAVLHHLVAQSVAESTDVRLRGLLLGSTHTHAGPGQFHSSEVFNRFGSNRPGFDPAYTQFLVDRVAGAVEEAVATRRPARLAFGRTEVWGFTRNRSHGCYVRNETVTDRRTDPQRKWAAINPWLHLLRVDAAVPTGGDESLGAMVWFSIHGTGISHHDRSYNADVWAYISGELARRVEATHGRRPVVGAMEGTHGDMTPAVRPGMLVFPEAQRVGCGIGAAAAELYGRLDGELTDQVILAAGLREIDLHRHRVIDGIALASRAAFGPPTLAGANENNTPLIHRIPPFRPGYPKPWKGSEQGAKWILGSRWVQPLVVPPASFPHVLPVQVLRIGHARVVGLPFEMTVESGRRIEAAVAEASGSGHVVVSSVANDYWCYATTPEEYGLQYYEGSQTIYGPNTTPFLTAHAARLAADVERAGRVTDLLTRHRFRLEVHRYLPEPQGDELRRTIGEPAFADPTPEEDAYWEVVWRDVSPGDLAWHEPLVRVEASDPRHGWVPAVRHGYVVDDQGWHVGVVHLGPDGAGRHRYAARWYDPDLRPGRQHRFVLTANNGRPQLASPAFD